MTDHGQQAADDALVDEYLHQRHGIARPQPATTDHGSDDADEDAAFEAAFTSLFPGHRAA